MHRLIVPSQKQYSVSNFKYLTQSLFFTWTVFKTVVRNAIEGQLGRKGRWKFIQLELSFQCASIYTVLSVLVLKGHFIQIKVLGRHERAPLYHSVLYWTVSVFRSTEIHRLSFKAGGQLKISSCSDEKILFGGFSESNKFWLVKETQQKDSKMILQHMFLQIFYVDVVIKSFLQKQSLQMIFLTRILPDCTIQ